MVKAQWDEYHHTFEEEEIISKLGLKGKSIVEIRKFEQGNNIKIITRGKV